MSQDTFDTLWEWTNGVDSVKAVGTVTLHNICILSDWYLLRVTVLEAISKVFKCAGFFMQLLCSKSSSWIFALRGLSWISYLRSFSFGSPSAPLVEVFCLHSVSLAMMHSNFQKQLWKAASHPCFQQVFKSFRWFRLHLNCSRDPSLLDWPTGCAGT